MLETLHSKAENRWGKGMVLQNYSLAKQSRDLQRKYTLYCQGVLFIRAC